VQKVAEDRSITMAEVALAWSPTALGHLDHSRARTVSQLETNLRAAGLHLTAAETAALDAASDPHPVDYPYGELGIDQRDRRCPGADGRSRDRGERADQGVCGPPGCLSRNRRYRRPHRRWLVG